MTHFEKNRIILKVRTLFPIIFLFLISEAHAFGIFNSKHRTQENRANQTEANYCFNCAANNSLRSQPYQRITDPNNLANGMSRALTSIFATCSAATPLQSFEFPYPERHTLMTSSEFQALQAQGFQNSEAVLTNINTRAPVAGVYQSSVNDARGSCLNSAYRNQHKAFGIGAGGYLNSRGEYSFMTCEGQRTAVQKAYQCGLAPRSPNGLTMDCAELIGAATIGSCLKLNKNQRLGANGIYLGQSQFSTHSLRAQATDANSCLNANSPMSAGAPIVAGDIMTMAGHSIVITGVSNDPLGIQKANGNCSSIRIEDMNFTFAHSASVGRTGPMNISARAYYCASINKTMGMSVNECHSLIQSHGTVRAGRYRNNTSLPSSMDVFPLNKIRQAAVGLCERLKSGNQVPAASIFNGQGNLRHLRHKGTSDCKMSPDECPKIQGDECADDCGLRKVSSIKTSQDLLS